VASWSCNDQKIIFYPYGISGTQSSSGKDEQRYSEDDDFVLIQYGTNDRFTNTSNVSTYTNLRSICEMLKDKFSAKPILLCSCLASEEQETTSASVTYFYHMKDVRNAIANLASDLGVPFIDNYSAFIEYAEQKDITTDDLLADGLHPNDRGYRVMYMNIMKALGLTRPPYYEEWLGD
jgi:lysophospholipase L1-like esterase